jgi:UDP-GlcNAc:undecaprenyl-phosphate GlcNAc-1-phosphate transferase
LTTEVGSIVIVAIAAAATWLLTFPIRKVAVGRGLVVMPDAERVHTRPTPTAGGTAIALGFAIAILAAGQLGVFHADFYNSVAPAGVLTAVAVMCVLGLVDDVRSVSPPAKVAGQVLAAMVLYFFGVTMTQFKVPFLPGYILLGSSILPLVTALWVIGIANAVNLIDGLDGLAAGVIAIGSGALCIYGLRLVHLGVLPTNNIGPLLAAACCGVCLGFLPHNFHRAKIFMGDTGAMVLGLVMAAATMEIGGQATVVYSGTTYFFLAPLVVPFVILGVPILDTALSILRRAVRRTGVTERDLGHLHYRLMRLGHGHRRTVVLLWIWTFVLSALVLYPTFYPSWNGVLPFAAVILGIGLITIFRPAGRRRHLGPSADTPSPDSAASLGVGAAAARRVSVPGGPGGQASARRGVWGNDTPDRGRGMPGALPDVEGDDSYEDTAGSRVPGGADDGPEGYRRVHRRRFARHHPPMRG